MTAISRQSTLFNAEQWERVYEALSEVDFRAYDQDTLRVAMRDYIRRNYPEEFNDWIGSDEFIIKIDILAWLSQNISWRVDLNSRENFLSTAERRESLLRLAYNIAYKVSRNRAASGEVRIKSIRTNQPLLDPDGVPINGRVVWNDVTDLDWRDKWNTIMGAVLSSRTPIGRPLRKYTNGQNTLASYRLNSLAPASGVYKFSAPVTGGTLPFELVNSEIDPVDGTYEELVPNPGNAMHVLYRSDGLGDGSSGTGWFMPFRQGTMQYQDELFSNAVSLRRIDIDSANINETDVWVTEVNADGTLVREWERVDSTFGEGIAFNTLTSDRRYVFEVLTRADDRVTIRFGDGKWGEIPTGRFRVWYRTSTPTPRTVRATDVRNKQVTVPYVSGTEIYNLVVTYSLTEDVSNGASSESDADIRTRANKVYYSQNRMVTGEDYNSYPLIDTSIIKTKAVNRTYAGFGLGSTLRDPTGTYSNVKLIGEDGRVYRRITTSQQTVSADLSVLSADTLITGYLQPVLSEDDKEDLYYSEYSEIVISERTYFLEDAVVNGWSRGRLQTGLSGQRSTVAVGDSATVDALDHIRAGAMVRLDTSRGSTARVDFTVSDGLVASGVLFRAAVPDDSLIYSVLPAFRDVLSADERQAITDRIILKRGFGIRWDYENETWAVVLPANLDTSSDFSLMYAGDISGTNKDASWFVRFEYAPEGPETDVWVIHDRGLNTYFASDRDVDFFYASPDPVVDAETGRALRDVVKVLKDNETRDSALRRNFRPAFGVDPTVGAVLITGDGTTTQFDLFGEDLDPDHVFVRQNQVAIDREDYSINSVPGADTITFGTAPANGEQFVVEYDPNTSYMQARLVEYTGDDSTFDFDLLQDSVHTENVKAFVNGRVKNAGNDFTTVRNTGNDTYHIQFSTTPPDTERVALYSYANAGAAWFQRQFTSDGIQTNYETLSDSDVVWVFVDGKRVNTGYTLSKTNPQNYIVDFNAAPGNGIKIDIHVLVYPELWKIREVTVASAANGLEEIAVPGITDGTEHDCYVWIDGVLDNHSFENGTAFLSTTMSGGERIIVSYVSTSAAPLSGRSVAIDRRVDPTPTYVGEDRFWYVTGALTHSDGHRDPNGVAVRSADQDGDFEEDRPFLFRDTVLTNGNDKVLWRKITEQGFEVWDPISTSTSPRGTYEDGIYSYSEGEDIGAVTAGSIHLDSGLQWLVADATTSTWVAADDQTAYRWDVGRGGLRFQWTHYSGEDHRIDPSPTNVVDVFVLPSTYDTAVRTWVAQDGDAADEPEPPTPEALKITYDYLEEFKSISDAIVWRPARYKMLFGAQAAPDVRADIVVVKVPGTTIPDSDVKLKVLAAIDDYFAVDNWDFGESFYYTELAAYIHQELSTVVQSVVVVPEADDQKFGRLFQVRAESDELFLSVAKPEDVLIVSSLTDTNLKIGS